MEQAEKEICDELIIHANSKKEVKKVMLSMFPKLKGIEFDQYLERKWKKKVPKGKISLRGMDYKEKKSVLQEFLYRKEIGEIKHIYLYIRKGLSKETPYEFYIHIIGKENMKAERRELQRGSKVELISFSNDMGRLLIEDTEWKGYKFYFTIWDINCTHDVITE